MILGIIICVSVIVLSISLEIWEYRKPCDGCGKKKNIKTKENNYMLCVSCYADSILGIKIRNK